PRNDVLMGIIHQIPTSYLEQIATGSGKNPRIPRNDVLMGIIHQIPTSYLEQIATGYGKNPRIPRNDVRNSQSERRQILKSPICNLQSPGCEYQVAGRKQLPASLKTRSEERRVGKECWYRWSTTPA